MNTHIADGLYYLSYARIQPHNPCVGHRRLWLHLHGRKRVPVTLALLLRHEEAGFIFGSASFWLLQKMRNAGVMLPAEEYRAWMNFRGLPSEARVLRVMDFLAQRAKREGLLP